MDMGFTDSRTPETGDSIQGLRPLDWAELRARLAAAQDLRRVLAPLAESGAALPARASFHVQAAQLLRDDRYAEEAVNPTSSAIGKGRESTRLATHTKALPSDPDALTRREMP